MEQSTTEGVELEGTDSGAAGPAGDEIQLRTVSVVEAAADALRQMILDGVLEPGERLRETDFSRRLGIARHTFRAATQILIGEGLLRRSPNRGVQLAVLDADDIADIFRIRAALELEAVRLAITSGAELKGAEAAVERLNQFRDSAAWRSIVDADMSFHRAIIDAAGSERMDRAYAAVQAEILLCMAQLRPHYNHSDEVAQEHRDLLEPLLGGDLKLAEKRFRAHLDEANENLTKALNARKEVTA